MSDSLPTHNSSDLVEKVAAWLYAFEGSPAVPEGDVASDQEAYRNRAVTVISLVRDHDAERVA